MVLPNQWISSVISNQIIPDSKLSKDHLPNTIVPFRNGTMLSIATAFADAWDIDAIYIGATYADESGYPDCRPEFFWAMQNVLFNGSSKAHPILEVPLGDMDKSDVINLGKKLKVPFKDTWSCYSRSDDPCGNCLACNVRKKDLRILGWLILSSLNELYKPFQFIYMYGKICDVAHRNPHGYRIYRSERGRYFWVCKDEDHRSIVAVCVGRAGV